ncbi:MAG: molybdopterin-binding protein [Bradyrhizobium sp.]|uniref:molybdopterin-binding protein n=1 Tax=Bradyrhizobium sp. TaxID=376 RepID=UPI003D09807C
MTSLQRLPALLTPLDVALDALLNGLQPVAPVEVALEEARGCIAARSAPPAAIPSHDVAAADGFALHARDLVGASSYSPLPLMSAPVWVEAGEAMPAGCDCVVDADSVDVSGPIAQVMAEAVPGQGVRRSGSDIAAGEGVAMEGRRILTRDLLIARAAGLTELRVRRPRLHIVNIPGGRLTADLIAESARQAGAEVNAVAATARDAASIAAALDTGTSDLLISVGGSGVGRSDETVLALAGQGEVLVHGIALQPGRTAAIGRIGKTPVVALPGAPDHAIAAWWTLALPALDRLSGRLPRKTIRLPLARKVASSVGLAEVVLLTCIDGAWVTLAAGELSLQAIVRAEAWLTVPGGSEGFAAGTPVDAHPIEE